MGFQWMWKIPVILLDLVFSREVGMESTLHGRWSPTLGCHRCSRKSQDYIRQARGILECTSVVDFSRTRSVIVRHLPQWFCSWMKCTDEQGSSWRQLWSSG